jgi:hypothetical protein
MMTPYIASAAIAVIGGGAALTRVIVRELRFHQKVEEHIQEVPGLKETFAVVRQEVAVNKEQIRSIDEKLDLVVSTQEGTNARLDRVIEVLLANGRKQA